MTETFRPPIGASMRLDGRGNYLVVGQPVHIADARTLGANPAATDASVLIDKRIVDHFRKPKAARLWELAMQHRKELRREIRRLEAQVARLTAERDRARRTSRTLVGNLRCFDYTDDDLREATGLDPLPRWLTADAEPDRRFPGDALTGPHDEPQL